MLKLTKIPPKYLSLAKLWTPSVVTYSIATLIFTLYVTDWRWICEKIPFYGKKFKEHDELIKIMKH